MTSTSGVGERTLGFSHTMKAAPATSQVSYVAMVEVFIFGCDGFDKAIATLVRSLGLPERRASDVRAALTELNNGKKPLPGNYVPMAKVREALAAKRASETKSKQAGAAPQDVSTASKPRRSGEIRREAAKGGKTSPTAVTLPRPGKTKAAQGAPMRRSVAPPTEAKAGGVLPLPAAAPPAASAEQSARKQEGERVTLTALPTCHPQGAVVDVTFDGVEVTSGEGGLREWVAGHLAASARPDTWDKGVASTVVSLWPKDAHVKLVKFCTSFPDEEALERWLRPVLARAGYKEAERIARELAPALLERACQTVALEPVSRALTAFVDNALKLRGESLDPQTKASLLALKRACTPGANALMRGRFPIYELAKLLPRNPMLLGELGFAAHTSIAQVESTAPSDALGAALVKHMAGWSRDIDSKLLTAMATLAGLAVSGPVAGVIYALASRTPGLVQELGFERQRQLLADAGGASQAEVAAARAATWWRFFVGSVLGGVNATGAKLLDLHDKLNLGAWAARRYIVGNDDLATLLSGTVESLLNLLSDAAVDGVMTAPQSASEKAEIVALSQRLLEEHDGGLRLAFAASGAEALAGEEGFETMVVAYVVATGTKEVTAALRTGELVQSFEAFSRAAMASAP